MILHEDWVDYGLSEMANLLIDICDEVFKNGPSKICRRQPLKNLKEYGLLEAVC